MTTNLLDITRKDIVVEESHIQKKWKPIKFNQPLFEHDRFITLRQSDRFIEKKLTEFDVSSFTSLPISKFKTRFSRIGKAELGNRKIELLLESMFTKKKWKRGILCKRIYRPKGPNVPLKQRRWQQNRRGNIVVDQLRRACTRLKIIKDTE